MGGRIVPAAGDHPRPQAPHQPAQGHTDGQATKRHQNEGDTRFSQRERTGNGCDQGKLEGHQTRRVVHQRFPLKHMHQRRWQTILGNRRHRHSVSWRQHRSQGKRHR
ncbi:hypothetical protein D3C78_1289290 [compost metagenome]